MALPNVYISNLKIDENYRKKLISWNNKYKIFNHINKNGLIDTINHSLKDSDIIYSINKLALEITDVLILLLGKKMPSRNDSSDFEVAAAMESKTNDKKTGIIVILLPESEGLERVHSEESEKVIFKNKGFIKDDAEKIWNHVSTIYPKLFSRIIDNIISSKVNIDIVKWSRIEEDPRILKKFISIAIEYGKNNEYVTTRPLRHKTVLK